MRPYIPLSPPVFSSFGSRLPQGDSGATRCDFSATDVEEAGIPKETSTSTAPHALNNTTSPNADSGTTPPGVNTENATPSKISTVTFIDEKKGATQIYNVRSDDAAFSNLSLNSRNLLHYMPDLVPFNSGLPTDSSQLKTELESLKDHINDVAKPGFNVHIGGTFTGQYFKRRLDCVCKSKPTGRGHGTLCKWSVAYELTLEGWSLSSGNRYALGEHPDSHTLEQRGHNHAVSRTVEERLQYPSSKRIPKFAYEVARAMASTNASAGDINKTIRQMWLDEHSHLPDHEIPQMEWNYQNIRHEFTRFRTNMELDWEGFLERIEDRYTNEGLHRYLQCDPCTGRMQRAFVELHGAREEWAIGGTNNVLLLDPTHATNELNWPLCLLVTVCSTGETVILGYALINRESHQDFAWLLQCFAATSMLSLRK